MHLLLILTLVKVGDGIQLILNWLVLILGKSAVLLSSIHNSLFVPEAVILATEMPGVVAVINFNLAAPQAYNISWRS